MSSISAALEGTIDFQGQVLAEKITQIGIILAAVLAFAVGQFFQSFELLLLVFGGGVVITLLAVLPPWPMYNRHPVSWLKPLVEQSQPGNAIHQLTSESESEAEKNNTK
ncbi:hypothetical protein H4R33_001054 [Dimargaris cristalligena]|uniref:Signal peptidase complex subunit 1 n=1 Tax=Dimargaris cristalligena TaxID=215637 RepID=A0A4P9ZN73_9FUNG|nr:hypothetical protein H4R33_001054 [Dimargaris cristalligena]RKP34605.1 microsomal signal peptidase 12 kDa subunit-domain-containing protein [Dimargaris cristalligena]|eukprot:RKP34605.1 microsomal signal peptidase 12 kDa subunit-domain-containing protein [Dimargaris cristalligena]